MRSPKTPQLRNLTPGVFLSAQYSNWLRSSGSAMPARTAGSGSHRGDPAVIESPIAATTGLPPSLCVVVVAGSVSSPPQP